MIVACYIENEEALVYILYLEEDKQLGDGMIVSIIFYYGTLRLTCTVQPSKRPVKFTQDNYQLSDQKSLFQFTRLLYLFVQYVMDNRNVWNGKDLKRWEKVIQHIDLYTKLLKTTT